MLRVPILRVAVMLFLLILLNLDGCRRLLVSFNQASLDTLPITELYGMDLR